MICCKSKHTGRKATRLLVKNTECRIEEHWYHNLGLFFCRLAGSVTTPVFGGSQAHHSYEMWCVEMCWDVNANINVGLSTLPSSWWRWNSRCTWRKIGTCVRTNEIDVLPDFPAGQSPAGGLQRLQCKQSMYNLSNGTNNVLRIIYSIPSVTDGGYGVLYMDSWHTSRGSSWLHVCLWFLYKI